MTRMGTKVKQKIDWLSPMISLEYIKVLLAAATTSQAVCHSCDKRDP